MGIAVTGASAVRVKATRKNPIILDDIAVLRRKWHAALLPGVRLPPFEEIMLGSLGRLADNIGLIRTEAEIPKLLRAGRYVQNWLGHEVRNTPISDLSPECAMALTDASANALRLAKPYLASAFRVRNGIVESYDVLALPMSCRWGQSMIAVYICEKGERYNLVDTIFQATDQGIVTLATIRDEQDRPVDFQIVDLNNGASRLLRVPLDEPRWRRLSEGGHGLGSAAVVERLRATIETGCREEFEIELGDGLAHIRIGVTAIGDLLSATLTDVTDLKRREQSFRLLFENNPMPMWVFDATTRQFLSVNDAAVTHYGYYRAKAEQRGTHRFFEQEMDRQAQHRRALESDLRRAFTSGEFELHYQPLIDLAKDRITAFEALLRWRHPIKGMVSPAEFIPVAEDTGLIVALGEWVLRSACAEAARWPDDIRIAVNLSPVQFRNRGLVQAVIAALAYSGLAPQRLELEITESVLLAETDSNLATLHQLRGLGVRISMDDFGTGYSSLSYLRAFPFDKIKIDRSFVSELANRPDCVAIVRAISGLGRSLGITTTAEGVETAEQLDRLRIEGCTEVQGFLFSAARPAAEVAALLVRFGEQASQAA